MKVLILVPHFPPEQTGGTEWEAYRTARQLIKRGHCVRVFCISHIEDKAAGEGTWKDEVIDGISVRRFSFDLNVAPDRFQWEYDNPWNADAIRKLVVEFEPEMIQLFSGYLITGSFLRKIEDLRIPVLLILNDFWFLCKRITLLKSDGTLSQQPIDPIRCAQCLGEEGRRYRIPGRLFPGLMNAFWGGQTKKIHQVQARIQYQVETLDKVDLMIGRSQFLCDQYIEFGVHDTKIRMSRQGLDSLHFTNPQKKTKASAALRIDYMGQIVSYKGVHIFVNALAKVPELPIIARIYGKVDLNEPYGKKLAALAQQDARVSLMGAYHGPTELDEIYTNNDLVVVPSLCYENSPTVILEAFARQTPVITTNLGGMAELVQHEKNGLLFEMGNVEDLAQQMRRLMAEPSLFAQLTCGIQAVKTVDQEMDELEETYQSLMKSYAKN